MRLALSLMPLVALAQTSCGGALTWNPGCRGGPVSFGCPPDAGAVDAGPTTCKVKAGDSCFTPGDSCLAGSDCNGPIVLTCQAQPECPKSRMRFKQDISYLTSDQLAAMNEELMALPLATYRYKSEGDAGRVRLGFMIDGHEDLVAVDSARDQVDLYSYTSMAVAALKVQAAEIRRLEDDVARLERELQRRQPDARRPLSPRR